MENFEYEKPPFVWGAARDNEDIAAIFFVSSKNQMMKFIESAFSLLEINPKHTDMSLLHEIRRQGTLDVRIWPFPSDHKESNPHLNLRLRYINSEGFFDVAPLGMWLTGVDPRNNYGFLVSRDYDYLKQIGYYASFAQNAPFKFDYKGHLWINETPIYCLHIHSKQIELFSQNWQESLNQFVERSQKFGAKIEGFNLKLFLSLYYQNVRNHTFLRYTQSFIKWLIQRAGVRFRD